MTDHTDLLRRFRHGFADENYSGQVDAVMEEAAKTIESLQADNAALRQENELMHTAICDAVTHLNTGYPHDASIVLRTELVRVADAAMLAGEEKQP